MKTACEEAAERFGMIAHLKREESSTEYADYADGLVKRLRAEGRELKRLRNLIVDCVCRKEFNPTIEAMDKCVDEAARIKKERKAK